MILFSCKMDEQYWMGGWGGIIWQIPVIFLCQCHRHSLSKLPIDIYCWGLLTGFKLCWSDDVLHIQIEKFHRGKHCFCLLSFSFCFLVLNFSKKTNQNMHQMEAQQQKSCHWQKKYCLMQFSSLLFTFLKTCQLLESQKRGGLLLGPSLLHVMNVSPILPISQAFHGGFHQECVVASALQYYNAK